jgi:hypothetical protein
LYPAIRIVEEVYNIQNFVGGKIKAAIFNISWLLAVGPSEFRIIEFLYPAIRTVEEVKGTEHYRRENQCRHY